MKNISYAIMLDDPQEILSWLLARIKHEPTRKALPDLIARTLTFSFTTPTQKVTSEYCNYTGKQKIYIYELF